MNLFDGLFGWRPGRFAMVVLGNVIGLVFVAGGILDLVFRYLGILGVTTTAIAGVIVADYFIVRGRQLADPSRIENVNWAGVVSVRARMLRRGALTETGVTQLGFLVSLVVVMVVYPILRRWVLRESTTTVSIDREALFADA